MSKTIDEKVVQMRFDNKDFESNVQTSLGTIGRLKQALNFKDSSKSLDNIGAAAKGVNMSPLASAVGTVQAKFSALEVMAVTALANITNSAVNAGKKMVSALTIDPIKTGFQEYETQMNAIQTILANTQSKGSTLTDVNKALDELNTYADKTIYNFTEMTRNIGTFTAAGVDLQTSVDSIKGIANLAAVSGSSSQQASTAMYQLSQALATGTVRLQDWNSVVNAGMGGELFQNALKRTAEHQGKNVDALIKKYGSFRDSLTKGEWLTTEVLTETLKQLSGAYTEADLIAQGYTEKQAKEITQLADTAVNAATKVKTVTQLWDTLKEAAQSGWAQSWRIIMGDFEEAKEMLSSASDYLGKFIASSAESRNNMLTQWKDLGGRTALIESIKNAFQGLLSVIKPVKEAFSDIFPAITGAQLADFTKGLQNLTSKFKVSDETANKIKRTFKGLFSIVDIGKSFFMGLGQAIGPVGGILSSFGNGILSVTATIGDYITGIALAIKKTDLFGNMFKSIGGVLAPIGSFISGIIDTIAKGFDKIDGSSITSLANNIKNSFSPLKNIGSFLSTVFAGIGKGLSSIGEYVREAFSSIGDSISKGLVNTDFDRLLGLITGGMIIKVIQGIKSLINNIKDGGGVLTNITKSLDGIRTCLESYQKQLKANILIKIAAAIGILAAALVAISTIDSNKLAASTAVIGGLMAELFGSMFVFDKLSGNAVFNSLTKVCINMILLSTAVTILAGAMKKISGLSFKEVAQGLLTVAGLCAALVASSIGMSKASGGMISSAIGLVIFAGAINILVSAVKKLGSANPDSIIQGLMSVGVLCAELTAFLNFTKLDNMGLTKGLGLMTLATSILILGQAVKMISSMDVKGLIKGLGSIGIMLAELSLFTNFTSNSGKILSTAIAMTILGVAMNILAPAIRKLGDLSMEQIAKGLLSMAGALTIITLAVRVMPANMIVTSLGLVAVATSLVIMANALKTMGGMSWEGIAKSLLTLAGSLTILAVALIFMTGSLPGAAALLVVSLALATLAPVLLSLSGLSWEQIAKGLLTLAGAFVIIGAAGFLLTPFIGTIALLGGAITLLGIGCLAAGAGVLAFSVGLSTLATLGAAGVETILRVVQGFIDLIPSLLTKIAEALVGVAQVIITSAPTITAAITTIIGCVLEAIVVNTPKIVEALVTLLINLLQVIANKLPEFITAGVNLIKGFIQGIADNIGSIVDIAIQIPLKFIEAVSTKIPLVVDSGFKLIIQFINGLTDAIASNTPALASAIERLITTALKSGAAIIKSFFGTFLSLGTTLMSNLKNGIQSRISSIISTVRQVPQKAVSAIKSGVGSMVSAGAALMSGLAQGIRNGVSSAINAVKSVASSVISKAKSAFGINSPSRVFAELGKFNMMGLANGISKYSKLAVNATAKAGNNAVNKMNDSLSSLAFQNVDTQPVIKPVFDMSDIQNGADVINSLFANNQLVSLGLNSNDNVSSISSMMRHDNQVTNEDVVSAIKDLKKSIDNVSGDTYSVNGITYDDGSNISNAIKSITKAAIIKRRI